MSLVPNKPAGTTAHVQHHRKLYERVFQGDGLVRGGRGVTVSTNAKGEYVVEATTSVVSNGMKFANPMEYDMSKGYPSQTWVYVSAGNSAATTGGIDADSGLPTTSAVGWYCSGLVSVPGPTSAPAYHLPQNPLPSPGTIGSALNWWVIYVGQSGGASNLNWRGYYNPKSTYGLYDMVYFGAGTASGTYISVIPSNTNAPDTGIGWVQSGGGNAWL